MGSWRSYKSFSECIPEALTSGFKCLLTSQIMETLQGLFVLVW